MVHLCVCVQYNVEECYERLKNGFDESADMSDFDSLLYHSQSFEGDRLTNAQTLPEAGRATSAQDQPWGHAQVTKIFSQEMSPSHFHGADWQQQLPYPPDDSSYDIPRPAVGNQIRPDAEAGESNSPQCVLHYTVRDGVAPSRPTVFHCGSSFYAMIAIPVISVCV